MIKEVAMGMRHCRSVAVTLLVLAVGWLALRSDCAAAAAPPEAPQTITLRAAIKTALESNLDLMQAGSLVDSKKISLRRTQGDFLPDLRFSMGASQSHGKAYVPSTNRYEGANSKSMSLQVSSSLDLFSGFGRVASLEGAGLELKAERKNLGRSREEIIFQTIQQYIAVAVDKELITADESYLEAQRRLLEQIDAFVQAGNRAIVDLYQQQSAVADAEGRIISARRNYEVDKLTLLQVIGFDPRAEVVIGDLDVDALTAQLTVATPDSSVDQALAIRADLAASRYQEQAAKKQITTSRSGFWPSLSLSASAGTSYRDPNTGDGSFSDQFYNHNVNGSVGLSVAFPIFDRLSTIESVADAKVSLRQAQLAREKLERQVQIDVRRGVQDYVMARKSVEVAQAGFEYSEQALVSMEERYRVGAATHVELSQAEATKLQSAYNLIYARYDLIMKSVAVSFNAGTIERLVSLID